MACWFSYSLFLKISAVTYTTVCCTACARVLSLDRCACLPARAGLPATAAPALSATRRQRRKVLKISAVCCTACARVLSLDRCACMPARAGPAATAAPALSATRRQRRKVDKCRVADKKQTNKPTDTHCSFIGIDSLHLYFLLCKVT